VCVCVCVCVFFLGASGWGRGVIALDEVFSSSMAHLLVIHVSFFFSLTQLHMLHISVPHFFTFFFEEVSICFYNNYDLNNLIFWNIVRQIRISFFFRVRRLGLVLGF